MPRLTTRPRVGFGQRASTLLVEHRDRDRVSEFVDRRFGESDKSLTAEEKMIERFAKERQVGSAPRPRPPARSWPNACAT